MVEIYVGIINRIQGNDRLSFSMIIDMKEISDDDKKKIGSGYTIKKGEKAEIFERWFTQTKEKGYWSPWMEEWTSATIYLLYTGEEQVNV